jgi:hypothetical protein
LKKAAIKIQCRNPSAKESDPSISSCALGCGDEAWALIRIQDDG